MERLGGFFLTSSIKIDSCELCGEGDTKLYRHHTVPKSEGGTHGPLLMCCLTCSRQVHMLFTNKELATMSREALVATESMKRYLNWKKKHPGRFRLRPSQRVRRLRNNRR